MTRRRINRLQQAYLRTVIRQEIARASRRAQAHDLDAMLAMLRYEPPRATEQPGRAA